MRRLAAALLLLTLPHPALAGDGALEINQTCAITTGCFPGDIPGFPVSIPVGAPRSYRLTSDLSAGTSNGIEVRTDDATIDLGGFRIKGPRPCTGSCPILGTNTGVFGLSTGLTVINGSIVGFDHDGVTLGISGIARSLHVHDNRRDGIWGREGCLIEDSSVHDNGDDGIVATFGCLVRGNAVRSNGGYGLRLESSAGYVDNAMSLNSAGNVLSGVNMGSNACNSSTCP